MTDPMLFHADPTGAGWLRIPDVDRLRPFLVSVASPSDLWLYASSAGGLTAGRVGPDGALFPYQTDDRLHRAHHDVGPWTALRVEGEETWEPFRPRCHAGIRRHLCKSVAGDQLVFEEEHLGLGLVFSYRWAFSERFGLVRTATLRARERAGPAVVRVVDGLQGLLPAGASAGLVATSSCLVDAYTRAEWDPEGDLALVSLEALPSDRAEPAESLVATVAWCAGLDVEAVLLSREQLDDVARGVAPRHEALVTGRPGAFLVASTLRLEPRASHTWHIVADVGRSHLEVAALRRRGRDRLAEALEAEVRASTAALEGILADVDGLQRTADPVIDAHHRANALYNAMRGGAPVDGHRVPASAFRAHVAARNQPCARRCADALATLGNGSLEVGDLLAWARERGDPDLERLALEMLPLWFGRRHGDPSRPWNRFSIRVRDAEGRRRVAWEGNWRDVLQNWEALLLAVPELVESTIAVFVNASTRDGHNPYRITSEGVDWEVPEPHNPWSNLGYWGDHQVSYLTRLLEASRCLHPGRLESMLRREVFSYADVPYRIRPYADLVRDPRCTVDFDEVAQEAAMSRVEEVGGDGRLVHERGRVLHVSLAEKLLVPVLAKLSTLVPGAGLWLHTQRPEWNDANNALAGFGVSVVTAGYLRRHLVVLADLLGALEGDVRLAAPVAVWLDAVRRVLGEERGLLAAGEPDDQDRRRILDALGEAAAAYRAEVVPGRVARGESRDAADLADLCSLGTAWLDHALELAQRPDGLYHGYYLVRFGPGTASVHPLYPMLEGQVAILSSGMLTPVQAADLVDRLYASDLYRADVDSFLLYPDRALPSFLDRNRVPEEAALAIPLVRSMLSRGDRSVVARDAEGALRFAAGLRHAGDLDAALRSLDEPAAARAAVLDLWEATFHHHAFTGRSGTMHAYEGLGSVYWHMVGKLLVAVQECWAHAARRGADPGVVERLARAYHRVRGGLGYHRSPEEFGAIPTDPYSHTPAGRGAQQPGMTGLVKEELVARRGELGVVAEGGCLAFDPALLDPSELVEEAVTWRIPAGSGPEREVEVPAGGLGFLLCGVPVVYRRAEAARIVVHLTGEVRNFEGIRLDAGTSQRIFRRDPAVRLVVASLPLPGGDP